MKKTLLLFMFLACITLVNAKDFPCAVTFNCQQSILHITHKISVSIRQGARFTGMTKQFTVIKGDGKINHKQLIIN